MSHPQRAMVAAKLANVRQGERTDIVQLVAPSDGGKARDRASKRQHPQRVRLKLLQLKQIARPTPMMPGSGAWAKFPTTSYRKTTDPGRVSGFLLVALPRQPVTPVLPRRFRNAKPGTRPGPDFVAKLLILRWCRRWDSNPHAFKGGGF